MLGVLIGSTRKGTPRGMYYRLWYCVTSQHQERDRRVSLLGDRAKARSVLSHRESVNLTVILPAKYVAVDS